MTSENDQPKTKRTDLPPLAMKSKAEQPAWGMWTPQMLRNEADKVLEAYGIAGEFPDKGDYTSMIEGLEQVQMANGLLERYAPGLRPTIRKDGLHNIALKTLQAIKTVLFSLQVRRAEAAGRHRSFRYLQDLMHFVARYEAELLLKDAAPKARGPKVQHSADHIRAVVAASPEKSMVQHAKELGCSRDTLYKALREQMNTI